MILLCKDLEKRLDHLWSKLQESERAKGPISQIDLDELCVRRLESALSRLEPDAGTCFEEHS